MAVDSIVLWYYSCSTCMTNRKSGYTGISAPSAELGLLFNNNIWVVLLLSIIISIMCINSIIVLY